MSRQKATPEIGARRRGFERSALTMLGVIALCLTMLNVASYSSNISIDVTKNNRFSVNNGTISILQGFNRPLQIKYVISTQRPKHLASLQRDVVNRIQRIAAAVGKEHLLFNVAEHVVEIEDTAAMLGELAKRGITPQSVNVGGMPYRFFSTIEINFIDAKKPSHIPVKTASAIEYELVTAALRLKDSRAQPPSVDSTIAKLQNSYTLTYIYGAAGFGITQEQQRFMDEIQVALRQLDVRSAKIQTQVRSAEAEGLTSSSPIGVHSSIYIMEDGGTEIVPMNHITQGGEVLKEAIAVRLWNMDAGGRKIGIYTPGRNELSGPEDFIYNVLGLSTEKRVEFLVERLGYVPVEVFISRISAIPDSIEALVIVRPSALSDREKYEISAYLAGGGKVLLWGGKWRVPLFDGGQRMNRDSESPNPIEFWYTGDATGEVLARRVGTGMKGPLKEYGIEYSDGFLIGGVSSIPYRVYGPQVRASDSMTAAPVQYPGYLPLVPYAAIAPERNPLATNIEALALRGSSPLRLNQERLSELGLKVETLLVAPDDSALLNVPVSVSEVALSYGTRDVSGILGAINAGPNSDSDWKPERLESASGLPVAIRVKGQFPFDATLPVPAFANDTSGAEPEPGPGAAFTTKPGELILVASPDALETVDAQGWRSGESGLVSGADGLAETSVRSMLANSLDAFVYGNDLIDVRRSLMPTPRRIRPWTDDDRRYWTALNVLLLPGLYVILTIAVWSYRRRRREAYEKQVGLRS